MVGKSSIFSKPTLNSLSFRKVDKMVKRVGYIECSCVYVYLERTLSGLPTIKDFLGYSRSPNSSDVKHWHIDIAVSGSRPLVAEIFPSLNETPL